jgi:hypothetical protein
MDRFLETLHAGLFSGRVVGVVDAALLSLGLTGTVAALAPVFLRVLARVRRAAPRPAGREDRR